MECNYKKNSVEPCKTCPRKITALYMCKLLQETAELAQKDGTIRIYAEEIVKIVDKADSYLDAVEELEELLGKIVRVSDRITDNTTTERIG